MKEITQKEKTLSASLCENEDIVQQPSGLYDSSYEHDACGVGMLVNIHGDKSHELVDSALKVLENMKHRGAEGADNKTGDGAGIMVQIPHEFILLQGIPVPEKGKYLGEVNGVKCYEFKGKADAILVDLGKYVSPSDGSIYESLYVAELIG